MAGEEDLMKQVEELKRRVREVEKGKEEMRRGLEEEDRDKNRKGRNGRSGIYAEEIGCWRVCEQDNGLCSACGTTRYGKSRYRDWIPVRGHC